VRPWTALGIVPSAGVWLGMYVQHSPPVSTHTPPFYARIMSRAIQFSHATLLVGSSCSAIPYIASRV
jgi:hypothetical protein